MSATAQDAKSFSGISASTTGFYLKGGTYLIEAVATWGGGNIELQALGPDGSTYLSLPTALKLTANGTIQGQLAPGLYRFTVTTATAITCSVAGIPV